MNEYILYYWAGRDYTQRNSASFPALSNEEAAEKARMIMRGLGDLAINPLLYRVVPVAI